MKKRSEAKRWTACLRWLTVAMALVLPSALTRDDDASGEIEAQQQRAGTILNLALNSDFEQVEDGKPVGWTIGDRGISVLTEEKVRTGKYALKIMDKSEKDGSNVFSARLPIKPGKRYAVRLWSYLVEGKPGLGVYFRFWDEKGEETKELADARERSRHVAIMKQGEWVQTFFAIDPPAQAKSIAIWLHTFSTAVLTCYVDDVQLLEFDPGAFEEAENWSGGQIEEKVVKVGKFSLRWAHKESDNISMAFPQPQDWSKFNAFSFWLNCEKATGSAFMLIIQSENPETEGMDYYSFRIILDFTGWRKFVLPFRELATSRQPVGWHKIDKVFFTASGWGNTPNPEAVVYLDGFEVIKMSEKGTRMTDEEFFLALNWDAPGMEGVKSAVEKGDLVVAKRELANHIRNRKMPRWFFDWRDHPFLGAKVPKPSEDKAPEQWDYYSLYITIDWQGWKHFTLKKDDFSPKAFVEGEGWKGKKPIGWHWIRYIMFSATGWDLKPDPECVLYFDDFKLVGKNKTVTISDFEREPIGWEGLTRSNEQAKEGEFSGKWENQITTGSILCWKIPHDWTEFDALDFWVYSRKATGSRIILVLDSDVPKAFKEADEICEHKFSYAFAGAERATIQFGEKIDWKANPTKGEARTHLWNEALNRHFHFNTLSEAYWQSGDEKYAKELVAQWLDWIEQNPVPLLSSGNDVGLYGCYAWQTLTTGIRLENTWPNALYRCLGSPAFTPEVITTILKSICEQARHLVRWSTSGNWLTEESLGLFTAGMLFPEFKEAKEWRRIALERLYKQLDEEVYPDGMEYELAAGYNNWVVSNFAKILDYAEMNNLKQEVPKDYKAKLEKMFNYLLYASMPDGAIPGLNDSGNTNVRSLLSKGYQLFPHREDFLYVATSGKQGKMPEHTSYAFPYTGHYVMRSGWDAEACYLLFDSGPFGYGHQHEDKLHFVLYAYGKQHILDPGNYSYDASKWRRYVISTAGHNTIMVDGQGQHRVAKRETYFWKRPWNEPKPPQDDTRWYSTKSYDYAVGTYRDGYGPQNDTSVTHTRRILFVKVANPYFIVLDTLTARDERVHRYDALFHLDTTKVSVDEQTKTVRTENEDASNLAIIPLADEGLKVSIVSGQEEPVQGWANHPWRAIPTAIYTKEGKRTVRFLYLLYPVPKGQQVPIVSVKSLGSGVPSAGSGQVATSSFIAVKITFADGRADYFVQSDEPGKEVQFGEFSTDGEVAFVQTKANGQVERAFQVGGKYVKRGKVIILEEDN